MLSFNFNPFPVLTTDRLILKQITADDSQELFFLRSSKDVMKYIDRPLAITMEDSLNLIQLMNDGIEKRISINWGIFMKGNFSMIGNIGFYRTQLEHYRSEIGYILHPQFQGQGIMSEALNASINYGFKSMKLHSIEANVNPKNNSSIKLLERNGFVREAYFKENYFFDGKFFDSAIYSLLEKGQRVNVSNP